MLGLREGSLVRREGDELELRGTVGARLFQQGRHAEEYMPGDRLDFLLGVVNGLPVTLDDVRAAARRIAPYVHRTPVVTSRSLDLATGARVFLKCENQQRVGAFKMRGATNAIAQLLTRGGRARGAS